MHLSKRVSVLIVNFNGKRFIEKLFSSLLEQTFKDYEIVFVDNASTDNSMEHLNSLLKMKTFEELDVKTIQANKNLGYCRGNNTGMTCAKGDYIVLLNNDAYVSPNWLEELVKVMDNFSNVGACQSKIVLTEANKNHLGLLLDYYGQSRVLVDLKNASLSDYALIDYSFYPSGASVIIRREAINECGFFDERLFFGDYDLSWRIRLHGYSMATSLKSVCFHLKGFTSGYATKSLIGVLTADYYTYKERTRVLIKNYSLCNLVKRVPLAITLMTFDSVFKSLLHKKPFVKELINSICWNIANFGDTIKQRCKVQQSRVVTEGAIEEFMDKCPFFIEEIKNRIRDSQRIQELSPKN